MTPNIVLEHGAPRAGTERAGIVLPETFTAGVCGRVGSPAPPCVCLSEDAGPAPYNPGMNTNEARRKAPNLGQIAVYMVLSLTILSTEPGSHVEVLFNPAPPVPVASIVVTGAASITTSASGGWWIKGMAVRSQIIRLS